MTYVDMHLPNSEVFARLHRDRVQLVEPADDQWRVLAEVMHRAEPPETLSVSCRGA